MELLIFLVGRREQLVSREEIVAKLWRSDLFIDTEPNINNIVRKIRTALGDDSARPRFLETVVGKGYRFIGPVRVIDARYPQSDFGSGASARRRPGERRNAWSERSSLAVLPLMLLGKATDDHGLCLGFADALVLRLGNLPGRGRAADFGGAECAGRERRLRRRRFRLGVRFVVHGAIQMSKGQWRLSLEMFDTHLQSVLLHKEMRSRHQPPVRPRGRNREADRRRIEPAAASSDGPARPRYSRDPMAYAEFMRGYRLSSSGNPAMLDEAAQHLSNAVTRDPAFSLAHAALSFVCATRHFEFDPASAWLEKAEFHCRRALELNPDLPEGHVASAFLLWGPSKNFQHLEAIAELKRALASAEQSAPCLQPSGHHSGTYRVARSRS